MSDNRASGRIVLTISVEGTGEVVSTKRIPFEQYSPSELERQVMLRAKEASRDYIVRSGKFGLDPFNRLNLATTGNRS